MVNIIIPFKRTFGSTYNSWSTFLQVVTEKWLLFIIIRKIFVVTTINVHGARHLTFFGITYKSLNFNCIFSAKYRSKNVIWLLILKVFKSTIRSSSSKPNSFSFYDLRQSDICKSIYFDHIMSFICAKRPNIPTTYIRYTFSSNHNIDKSSCGLCFWVSEPCQAFLTY